MGRFVYESRKRVYEPNLGQEKWMNDGEYMTAGDIKVLHENIKRITTQIIALLKNNCVHMDFGIGHNILGRHVGSQIQLNLIDWDTAGSIRYIYHTGLLRDINKVSSKLYHNVEILAKHLGLATIFCLCAMVKDLEQTDYAESMMKEILYELEHNWSLNKFYDGLINRLCEDCFGYGEITSDDIKAQANFLKVQKEVSQSNEAKPVEVMTLDQLKPSGGP